MILITLSQQTLKSGYHRQWFLRENKPTCLPKDAIWGHKYLPPLSSSSVYSVTAHHYIMMGTLASQITSLMIVYSRVHSGANQRKNQSSAFPFDDVIMLDALTIHTAIQCKVPTVSIKWLSSKWIMQHNDVIKWNPFPRWWPFAGNSPVTNSSEKI